MRTLLAVFAIGALLFVALARDTAPVDAGLEHRSAVVVPVGSGPEEVVTARGRQLGAAVRAE